jgi:hypothetical protein
MLKRLAFIAFAAFATMGIASLAVSNASAAPGHHGKGHHGKGHHGHHGKGHHGHHGKGHHGHRHRHGHGHRHIVHIRRWAPPVARTLVVTRPMPVAARPAPRNCLTKEYTDNGAVMFRDTCTGEWAMNPPEDQSGEESENEESQEESSK